LQVELERTGDLRRPHFKHEYVALQPGISYGFALFVFFAADLAGDLRGLLIELGFYWSVNDAPAGCVVHLDSARPFSGNIRRPKGQRYTGQ